MRAFFVLGLLLAGPLHSQPADIDIYSFDWRPLIAQLQITSGPYQGALRIQPGGRVDWYFSNIAVAHLLPDNAALVRAYLEAYLNHVDPSTHAISNYNPENPSADMPPDSTDSYAATFLSAAVAYMRATGDMAWWNNRQSLIHAIAVDNLLTLPATDRDSQGFTLPLRKFEQPRFTKPIPTQALLMDQAEVYHGLRDYGEYLSFIGDSYASVVLQEVARLGPAIHAAFWDESNKRWVPQDGPPYPFNPKLWYPDLACQIFPDLYDVRGNDVYNDTRRLLGGFPVLNQGSPNWATTSVDTFPWLVVGYYAALRQKNFPLAQQMLGNVFANFLIPTPAGFRNGTRMLVYDIAYAQSILRITAPWPIIVPSVVPHARLR
jgi:hypothetical protein